MNISSDQGTEQHTPTPAHEVLHASVLSTQVVGTIQQAYAEGKFIDLEAYNQLYAQAKKADAQVKKLTNLLETMSMENDQAIQCASSRAKQDMPYMEVVDAFLYKKVEFFGERPESHVLSIVWYVDVEILHQDHKTPASILYRVQRSDEEEELKATQVTTV